MPRSLVVSNGSLYVALDSSLNVREFTWPHVGQLNQLHGKRLRLGISVDGQFSWIDEQSWHITPAYEPGRLITHSTAEHVGLQTTLNVKEWVDPQLPAMLRLVTVHNLAPVPRLYKLFMAQDFDIAESDIGDTVFYHPDLHSLVHHKRNTWILCSGTWHGSHILEYSCGTTGFRNAEGTWRDAEDSRLEMHAIAQGSVDSVYALGGPIPGFESVTSECSYAVGDSLEAVTALHRTLAEHGFDALIGRARTYWDSNADDCPSPQATGNLRVSTLAAQSVAVMVGSCDRGGGVIAAIDSDILQTARAHYAYVWPRDGALVAHALARSGCAEHGSRFLEFCARLLPQSPAILLHKYCPDGSMGSSWHPWVVNGERADPVQEDGTALVIWSAEQILGADLLSPAGRTIYETLILPAALALAAFVDPTTGLPRPSWDLWEERRGIHAYTCGAVIGALLAASRMATEVNDDEHAASLSDAADALRSATLERLYVPADYRFSRSLVMDGSKVHLDMTPDASLHGLWMFGAFSPDDPRIVSTMRHTYEALWVQTSVGGMARYTGDNYFRQSDCDVRIPGNPWVICTLWHARWLMACAVTPADLEEPVRTLLQVTQQAMPGGHFAEQLHPETGTPLSVAPLTWSHAEFVAATLDLAEARTRVSA